MTRTERIDRLIDFVDVEQIIIDSFDEVCGKAPDTAFREETARDTVRLLREALTEMSDTQFATYEIASGGTPELIENTLRRVISAEIRENHRIKLTLHSQEQKN